MKVLEMLGGVLVAIPRTRNLGLFALLFLWSGRKDKGLMHYNFARIHHYRRSRVVKQGG